MRWSATLRARPSVWRVASHPEKGLEDLVEAAERALGCEPRQLDRSNIGCAHGFLQLLLKSFGHGMQELRWALGRVPIAAELHAAAAQHAHHLRASANSWDDGFAAYCASVPRPASGTSSRTRSPRTLPLRPSYGKSQERGCAMPSAVLPACGSAGRHSRHAWRAAPKSRTGGIPHERRHLHALLLSSLQ